MAMQLKDCNPQLGMDGSDEAFDASVMQRTDGNNIQDFLQRTLMQPSQSSVMGNTMTDGLSGMFGQGLTGQSLSNQLAEMAGFPNNNVSGAVGNTGLGQPNGGMQGLSLPGGSASFLSGVGGAGNNWDNSNNRADSIIAAAISASNNSGMAAPDILGNQRRASLAGAMNAGLQQPQVGQLLNSNSNNNNNWLSGNPAMGKPAAGLNLGGMQANSMNANMFAGSQDQSWTKNSSLTTMANGSQPGNGDFSMDMQSLLNHMNNGALMNGNHQIDAQLQQALFQQQGGQQDNSINGFLQNSNQRPQGNAMMNQNNLQDFGGGQNHAMQQQMSMMVNSMPLPTDADMSHKRYSKKKRAKTFPEKLMDAMIQFGNDASIAWLPDNKSFVIISANSFVDNVLNLVFKEAKYASFVRKLHRWGFVRLTSGTGTDCFHHPLFQRGRRDLASRITCTPRDKDGSIKGVNCGRNEKPPSLAGVERFIRSKGVVMSSGMTDAPSPPTTVEQGVPASVSVTLAAPGPVGQVVTPDSHGQQNAQVGTSMPEEIQATSPLNSTLGEVEPDRFGESVPEATLGEVHAIEPDSTGLLNPVGGDEQPQLGLNVHHV